MIVYLLIDLLIILLFILSKTKKYFHLSYALMIFILIAISSMRGNFTADYDNYIFLYRAYENSAFVDIIQRGFFSYPEIGYLFFQYVTKIITNNVFYIFLFSSILIVVANMSQIKKHSSLSLVALILFIEAGSFYVSFNLMRQVMSASIVLLGSEYLYDKKPFKFFIVTILAALFHKTALIMIPFYFIAHLKFKKISVIVFSLITLLLFAFLPNIISFVQKYYWSWYGEDGYGMIGYSFKNAIADLSLGIFAVAGFFSLKNNQIFKKDSRTNVWVNAAFILIVIAVLGMKVAMIKRFSTFFSTYVIMLIANELEYFKNKRILAYGIIFLAILYGFVTKISFPYKFFWR